MMPHSTRTLLNGRRHLVALRTLLVFTVLLGLVYPLALVVVGKLPGLSAQADGSLVKRHGTKVASSLIGQSFTTSTGAPIEKYFQSRPSAAGTGYDPTASGASNLGPQDVVDTPTRQSLLTLVCSRSLAIGKLDGVDGRRPYCTAGGVGAVLGVWRSHGLTGRVTRVVSLNETRSNTVGGTPFLATYRGVTVELAVKGRTYTGDVVTPIRGDAPAHPAVPADAVTSSGSGLDPDISVAYADIQIDRVARARGVSHRDVATLVHRYTKGRTLGFMGESRVNVVALNLALDRTYPR